MATAWSALSSSAWRPPSSAYTQHGDGRNRRCQGQLPRMEVWNGNLPLRATEVMQETPPRHSKLGRLEGPSDLSADRDAIADVDFAGRHRDEANPEPRFAISSPVSG